MSDGLIGLGLGVMTTRITICTSIDIYFKYEIPHTKIWKQLSWVVNPKLKYRLIYVLMCYLVSSKYVNVRDIRKVDIKPFEIPN